MGGALFALAVFTHLSVMFAIPIWIGTLAWMYPEQRRRCVTAFLMTGVVSLILNAGIYGPWTGDPLHQFRLVFKTHLNQLDHDPESRHVLTAAGSIDAAFFIRPVRDLLVSKALGLLGAIAVIGTAITWRQRTALCRLLAVAALLTWLWMSYGTHSPTRHAPFPGTTAYWQPLMPLLAPIVAELLLGFRRTILFAGALGTVVAGNLALCALSGSWGQSVRISSELLAYVREHPRTLFVTDDRTLTDFAVLDRFVLPSNVRGVPDSRGPKFVTADRYSGGTARETSPVILLNTLNNRPDNPSFDWLKRRTGKKILASPVEYRPLTYLLPAGYRNTHSWTVRKPAATAFLFSPAAEWAAEGSIQLAIEASPPAVSLVPPVHGLSNAEIIGTTPAASGRQTPVR